LRLLTFYDSGTTGEVVRQPAVVQNDRIFRLDAASLGECAALSMERLAQLQSQALQNDPLPLDRVRLSAPVRPCKNVFCVGRNYLDHALEGARVFGKEIRLPEVPTFFTKAATAIADPGATLSFSSALSQQYDWEGELCIVIGKSGRDIPEHSALDHVFGYTALNDVTARDLQRAHGQWFKGKSLDQSCPLGPWIVTADEITNPQELHLEVRVNGVTKQITSTSMMIFSVARVIAELSRGMTLDSSDLIATGTPAGVGFARTPPEFLRNGDTVEVEIERIGILRNTIAIA